MSQDRQNDHPNDKRERAEELFSRIAAIIGQPSQPSTPRLLHETLQLVCYYGLRHSHHAYGNLSSQVSTLCRKHHLQTADTSDLQRLRRQCSSPKKCMQPEDVAYGCRALSKLISVVFDVDIPGSIIGHIPPIDRPRTQSHLVNMKYVRCTVSHWDEHYIYATADRDDADDLLRINYIDTPEYIDHSYLRDILREGMQLNLLDCEANDDMLTPLVIVVEPDFLIDISVLASCFEDYGHHPLLYTLKRLLPRPNNRHTLLGTFAGSVLDNLVAAPEGCSSTNHQRVFADVMRQNFSEKALEFSTCADFDAAEFKQAAALQTSNLQGIVGELLYHYDRQTIVLEPTFVCEQLGLQGRVDMMTTDMKLLIEQKSGRNRKLESEGAARSGGPSYGKQIEKHYVQMLLYYGVLSRNFLIPRQQMQIMLLYSRYPLPQGLLEVEPLQKLLREAIALRNRIVANEYDMANGHFADAIDQLTPETLNTLHLGGFFYEHYLLPELQAACTPLHSMDELTRAYFCRMATFVLKEQLYSKVGNTEHTGNSVADLWNMPLAEKLETGNIITGLRLITGDGMKDEGLGMKDEDRLFTFSIPDLGDDYLPNFRRNDMLYLYDYNPDSDPDVRQSILQHATLVSLTSTRLVVQLTNAQHNKLMMSPEKTYAVEHAGSDISTSSSLAGLFQLVIAHADRRELLLGQRAPQINTTRQLTRSYHSAYDSIVLAAKQACDYYLLQGPPGTGKTSMALRFLVEEELADPSASLADETSKETPTSQVPKAQASILLMAYTNRALDEICGMLCNAGLPFVRLGSEYSCDPVFRPNLLNRLVAASPNLNAVRSLLQHVSIVVGTTASLMARPFVFAIRDFSLAIVDEASQILEPSIIGLLARPSAISQGNAIQRFILIGDHKQLPAVVQQSPEESAVDDPLLNSIGISDCRRSLFERLLATHVGKDPQPVGILQRQGRMHPDIAAWPSAMFYHHEQLQPVPLPHQKEPTTEPRMVFIPVDAVRETADGTTMPSDKANRAEAEVVARLLQQVYEEYGDRFNIISTVGVIVPYRNQITMIRRAIEALNQPLLMDISIDTVERYQGSLRDIIIYSTTVSHRYQLDFLTANTFFDQEMAVDRKLNVALTRARCRMFIVGHEPTLRQNPLYASLIEYIKRGEGPH